MALFQSKQILAGAPLPSPDDAYTTVSITAEYVTPAAGLAAGDIIEMGGIPPGFVPTDLIVHTGALGAGVTLDSGYLSGEYGTVSNSRTMGSEFFASPQSAATASLLRATKSLTAVLPGDIAAAPSGWGLKVAGATTAGAIKVRATLFLSPAPIGM